jgi:hypothetical protein
MTHMPEPRTRIVVTTSGAPGATMATIHEVEEPMSIADESNVPHRPAKPGDTVRVSFDGHVVSEHMESDDTDNVTVALVVAGRRIEVVIPRELAAVQRPDIPRYKPGNADRPRTTT